MRTPGYPALLAAILAMAGERSWAPSVVGALLATATALVIMFTFGRLIGERAARWAAVLLCLDFGSFARSLDVLSETPFALVLALAALVAAMKRSTVGLLPALASGLLLAVGVLIRPILLYFPLVAAVMILVKTRRDGAGGRRLIAVAGAFLAPIVLVVGGWILRNGLRTGAYVLTPVGGHQLLHRRAASVLAHATGRPLSAVQEELGMREAFFRWRGPSSEAELFGPKKYAELFPETARLSTPELEKIWKGRAARIFREHPWGTARMLAEGTGLLLFAPPPLVLFSRWGLIRPSPEPQDLQLFADQEIPGLAAVPLRKWPGLFALAAVSVAQLLAYYVLASVGILRLRRSVPLAAHAALIGAFLYLVAVSASTDAIDDRFRVPLMPLVCLYAGAALVRHEPPRQPAPLKPDR